ncbi:hypothetical protein M433DRAFT_139435 [Acidomyces richmondensis BFW]|nr:hypothetical protein M433DRAFT_139435 [Acidomyces richmondensis BFW]
MTRPPIGQTNGTALYNQTVRSLYISDDVRSSGQVSPEVIAEAVTFLHRDGIVVLENAIDPDHLNSLAAILRPEAEEIARDPDHHFNWNKGNMDQAPPLKVDVMFDDIWANPVATAILSAILGPNPTCHYDNGNTALKTDERQPVHSDIDKPHPLYPFAYAINIPLCDVSIENGSTEIWVGSHCDRNIDQHATVGPGQYSLTIKHHLLAERRKHSPPIQPRTKKGSVILRDLRLWHAGMPNRTEEPRIVLAFVVQPGWFLAPSKVSLPVAAKGLVERWEEETGLRFAADWIDGEVDHKKRASLHVMIVIVIIGVGDVMG